MKVFYSAYTCKGNTGDILINKLQIEEYARYAEVYVDCAGMPIDFYNTIFDTKNPNIKDFVKIYGVNYRSRNVFHVLRLLKKEHFTHFTKSPGPYAYIKLPIKTFLIRLTGAFCYWIAYMYGIRVIALGIDLGYSLEPKWLQIINNLYFSIYHQIGTRSLNNEQKLTKSLTNVTYIPDMAFLYPISKERIPNHRKGRVALSFRNVDDNNMLIEKLKTICNFFSEKNFGIEIIHQVEEDKDNSTRLFQVVKNECVHMVEPLIDYYSLDVYKKYDFVISNRLHVLLMAAMNGAIPYALISQNVKENKIIDVFSSVFESHLVSYIKDFELDIFNSIYNRQEILKNEINNCVRAQQSLCVNYISNMFEKTKK